PSTTSILVGSPQSGAYREAGRSDEMPLTKRSIMYLASSAVKGWPSCQVTPSRMVNVHCVKSSLTSHSDARAGQILKTSSRQDWTRFPAPLMDVDTLNRVMVPTDMTSQLPMSPRLLKTA